MEIVQHPATDDVQVSVQQPSSVSLKFMPGGDKVKVNANVHPVIKVLYNTHYAVSL